jgi:putative transposase
LFPTPNGGKAKFEALTVEGFQRAKSFAAFLKALPRGKLTTAEIKEATARFGLSRATLFRYKKELLDAPRISTIIRRSSRPRSRSPHFPIEVEDTITKVMMRYWKQNPGGNFEDLRTRVNQALVPHGITLSKSTIWRRFHALPPAKRHSAKYGAKDAQAKMAPLVGKTPEQGQPLGRVQIDSTLCDVWLVHPETGVPLGRAWVTFVLDECTRCILGFFLTYEAPSSASVAFALQHAVFPKDIWLSRIDVRGDWEMCGVPHQLYTDNGSEFRARAYEMGCEEWLIDFQYRPVARPRWGGQIERVIGTFMKQMRLLPGAVIKQTLEGDRKGYDPKKHACMTIDELECHLAKLIIAYHNRSHSGLGMPPQKKWRASIQPGKLAVPIRLPEDRDGFLVDFLAVFEPTLQRYGFRVQGLTYSDEAISEFQDLSISTRLIARRNPHDLSRLYVYHPIKRAYVAIRCFNADAPKTLSDLRRAKEFNKLHQIENSEEALARADAIQQAMESLELQRGKKRQRANRQNDRRRHSATLALPAKSPETDIAEPPRASTSTSAHFIPANYQVERF